MSVRVGDRSEGNLRALDRVKELKSYSLDKLKNPDVFPKSTRWLYAHPIANEVRNAKTCIRKANSVPYSNNDIPQGYPIRRELQISAHASLDSLYDFIEEVEDCSYISHDQARHWTKLVKDADNTLKAWMKSDKDKYTNYIKKKNK